MTTVGAVRIGDDAPLPAAPEALHLDRAQMVPQLISGDYSGTISSIRWFRELLTMSDRPRERGFNFAGDRRIERREHELRAARPRWQRSTSRRPISSGSGAGRRQAVASRTTLPSERWLALEQAHGPRLAFGEDAMNCWPTMPSRPRTPTGIDVIQCSAKKKADAAHVRVGRITARVVNDHAVRGAVLRPRLARLSPAALSSIGRKRSLITANRV